MYKVLSIPLNGFLTLMLMLMLSVRLILSIPLNGFIGVGTGGVRGRVETPFNSIEWIPRLGYSVERRRLESSLSIPLNGFSNHSPRLMSGGVGFSFQFH